MVVAGFEAAIVAFAVVIEAGFEGQAERVVVVITGMRPCVTVWWVVVVVTVVDRVVTEKPYVPEKASKNSPELYVAV